MYKQTTQTITNFIKCSWGAEKVTLVGHLKMLQPPNPGERTVADAKQRECSNHCVPASVLLHTQHGRCDQGNAAAAAIVLPSAHNPCCCCCCCCGCCCCCCYAAAATAAATLAPRCKKLLKTAQRNAQRHTAHCVRQRHAKGCHNIHHDPLSCHGSLACHVHELWARFNCSTSLSKTSIRAMADSSWLANAAALFDAAALPDAVAPPPAATRDPSPLGGVCLMRRRCPMRRRCSIGRPCPMQGHCQWRGQWRRRSKQLEYDRCMLRLYTSADLLRPHSGLWPQSIPRTSLIFWPLWGPARCN